MDFYLKKSREKLQMSRTLCMKSEAIIFVGVLWKPSGPFAGQLMYTTGKPLSQANFSCCNSGPCATQSIWQVSFDELLAILKQCFQVSSPAITLLNTTILHNNPSSTFIHHHLNASSTVRIIVIILKRIPLLMAFSIKQWCCIRKFKI